MKFAIERNGEDIITYKDFEDFEDRGEIAHILTELELAKRDLLEIWEEYGE